MANFAKWAQPKQGHRGNGGTRAHAKKAGKMPIPGAEDAASYKGENVSPFSPVGGASQQSKAGLGQSLTEAQSKAFQSMGPFAMPMTSVTVGGVPGMGPNAGGYVSTGNWGGKYGAVPNHHGWAGMQNGAKEWTLRMMGQFPELAFASGYRTPANNARVGGHPNSGHMRGWKVDFSGNAALLAQAGAWARAQGAKVLIHGKKDMGHARDHLDISWEGVGT